MSETDLKVVPPDAIYPTDEFTRGASEVRLGSGESVRYDQLVLATGASPRALSLPGVFSHGRLDEGTQ